MEIELRTLASIRRSPDNPRDNAAGVDAVAASIQTFGWRQPIVVDEDGEIVVGDARYQAAVKLGLERVPVHVARGLTPTQVRAYRIADNQCATLSGWNDDKLLSELAALQEQDFDLTLTGFKCDDLLQLLGSANGQGIVDPDAIPAPPDQAITRSGDLWLLGNHRLLCGDASKSGDVDRLLDGALDSSHSHGSALLCPTGTAVEQCARGQVKSRCKNRRPEPCSAGTA